jgi:energy-coupling factor transporter ATP-binding protein EcfA2
LSPYLPYLLLRRAFINLRSLSRLQEKHFKVEDQRKILEWLAPPDLKPPVTALRAAGTNEWLVNGELFRDWMAGKKQYVFLHGTVGCGKTTLLKTAASSCRQTLGDIRDHSKTFVITFFFSATTNQHFGLNDLLRRLIAQLSALNSIPDALNEMYRASTSTFPPKLPNDDEELTGVLSRILSGSSPSGPSPAPRTYILIDGLDEIATFSECRKVTKFLNDLAALGLQTLHILVTSRSLEPVNHWQPVWEQYAIPAQEVAQDIERYVNRVVSEELSHLSTVSRRKIITKLTGPEHTM